MKKRSISIAILFILGILGILHFIIYAVFTSLWHFSPAALQVIQTVFVILWLSFVMTSALTMRFYSRVGSWFYHISSVWLGTAYILFLTSILSAIILLFNPARVGGVVLARVIFLSGALISVYGLIHSWDTKIVKYRVALANLPEHWHNKTIALVSDLHFGAIKNIRFAQKTVEMIRAQKPDLLILAGDFFDGPPADFKKLASVFKSLDLPNGMFFANGNHEEFRPSQVYDDALREAGINVLIDELREVNGLQIIGTNFSSVNSEKTNAETLAKFNINPKKPSIYIKHAPNGVTASHNAGISLQVSGHTHSGQVWPGPWLTRRIFKEFAHGHHMFGDMHVITSSGMGAWGPPQRIGTDSELVLITLLPK